MFDNLPPRLPVSYARLFGGYGRFFGELWPGRWDSLDPATMKFESDLPNDMEALKALSRKLMTDLKKETVTNARFMRFCARLAKKLVCLGQMSHSEFQTSQSLGIKVNTSNLHCLVNGSPWMINPTLDAMTSTDSSLFREPSERRETRSIGSQSMVIPFQPAPSRNACVGTSMTHLPKTASESDAGSGESANVRNLTELDQLSGLSGTSVLSEPVEFLNPRATRLRRGEAELYTCPYRAPSSESGFNMRIPDSLVFLHKAGDFLYKESSETFCTPVLNPMGGFRQTSESAPQISNSASSSLQNGEVSSEAASESETSKTSSFNPSIGFRSLDRVTDIGYFASDQARQNVFQLEPDDEGLETILVMPDDDPLTHYQERITAVEYIHEQLQTELQGALKSAMDISDLASYIAKRVVERESSTNLLASDQSQSPIPYKDKGKKKSKIPVRVRNYDWKSGSVNPVASTPSSPYGEPNSDANASLQLFPELRNSRRRTGKVPPFAPTPSRTKAPAKRRNGTWK